MKTIVGSDIKGSLRARGICVIIPTYNNQSTIKMVVEDVSQYCGDILVVNDGSSDDTAHILQTLPDITIINGIHNKGKGAALKKGFQRALEMGFAYAITIDADGQHYAKDIPYFLEANKKYPGSLIVGSRKLEGVRRSKGSCFANNFSNFWFFLQTGRNLKDTQTGYRLYPLKRMRKLKWLTDKYEAELELLVFSSWHGVNLVSIPVDVYYPPTNERVSHFRPFRDFLRISLLNVGLCILIPIYGLPLRLWHFLSPYLRTAYTFLVFAFFSLVIFAPFIWIYVKLHKDSEQTTAFLHNLMYRIARFIMISHGIPGTRFSYSISENVHFDHPYVIICNHLSHFDTMCMQIFTPNMVFLTKDWVWNNPFYGTLIRNSEYLSTTEGDIVQLLPKMQNLVNRRCSIAIFPEGTRSKDGHIGRFHQGAFFIASKLGLEILPMMLYGSGKVLPPNTYCMNKGKINISVGNPITRRELDAMGNVREQTSCVRKLYMCRYEDLKNQMDQDS